MLVLNRKKGETIIIGDNIEISVVDVQGDNVKIGINAPREVSIYRKEIYDEIIQANRQACQNLDQLGNEFKKEYSSSLKNSINKITPKERSD